MVDNTEAICPRCDFVNNVSATELYQARAAEARALMTCSNCGRASEIDMSVLDPARGVKLIEWAEQLNFNGENGNWLPCLKFTGPESKLPAGAQVGPGDEVSPRLWLYTTANLDTSPDGTIFWKWDDFVRAMGYDPFMKLAAMRGPNWVKFMTKGRDPHIRTRVVMLR